MSKNTKSPLEREIFVLSRKMSIWVSKYPLFFIDFRSEGTSKNTRKKTTLKKFSSSKKSEEPREKKFLGG
jgi:hypothetical protein